MEHEKPLQIQPELAYLTDLPERRKLTDELKELLKQWSDRYDGDTELLSVPLAELIINDCRHVYDIDEELYRRDLSYASKLTKKYYTKRIDTLRPLSELANNETLDTLIVHNPHFPDALEELREYSYDSPHRAQLHEALTYLRRLYVAREQIALLDGYIVQDTEKFDILLTQLWQEFSQLEENTL